MPTCPSRAIAGAAIALFSLLDDFDVFPEGDHAFDMLRLVLRIGVVPGGIFVVLAVYTHGVIAGFAFPASGSALFARGQELLVNRFGWEVGVAVHLHGLVALGQNRAVPNCFCHG